jgi:hypothetical protein
MKTTVRWAASCIAVICSLSGCESDTAPGDELILYNGTVYTVDDKQPTAEAVAVRDGIIKSFLSQGPGNRICPRCAVKNERLGPIPESCMAKERGAKRHNGLPMDGRPEGD